jgi:hypothetical protein
MTTQTLSSRTQSVVERYVAMWNEPDPQVRHETIVELFTEDAEHILSAPVEMRDAARALGFPALTLAVRGHADLEFRVARAHDEFVGSGEYRFRQRGDGACIDTMVKFGWEMVSSTTGDVVAHGIEIVELDTVGRIRSDHQFVDM